MSIEQKYKVKEYVVAFIDVLGAKKKIQQDVNNSLNIVHETYNEAIEFLSTLYSGKIDILKPQIKIFSDNIVVAVPTDIKGRPAALMSVMIYAGMIQHHFLHHKYLVRGGISLGDFFVDDVMLWGTALTRAYEIESTIAIYPRIVLDPHLVGQISIVNNQTLQNWLSQDIDSLFYINYLQKKIMRDNNNFLPLVIMRLEEAEHLLLDAGENIKVHQKILWHLNYLRSCLENDE